MGEQTMKDDDWMKLKSPVDFRVDFPALDLIPR